MVVNPKKNASAMVLRSGKELQPQPTSPTKADKGDKEEERQDSNEGPIKIPKYAKFLKELSTNKRRLRIDEKVRVGENISTVIKRTLPEKRADPGMFTLPCVIGNKRIERAMLDLGASINVMPYSIYCALRLGPLKETRVVIQLVDRSNAYPEGIVEDVLEVFGEEDMNEELEFSAQLDREEEFENPITLWNRSRDKR
ncbi:PREDICTED: uncharacterized protein LOC104590421 [Nelumbo nucifera]|uniref:Uncharacterized protein LOC104590421 n=1 Tax=Nelumbo nucifera TaxID=4432 RepID=A0A1U8PZV6_NELNU|nr:PREDICTED: uncharacterized protein LOC104590421 [Nelumbo nucifera]